MKTKPILFSTEMVQAILEGRKTQTRREVNHGLGKTMQDDDIKVSITDDGEMAHFKAKGSGTSFMGLKSPYGKIGDILWVRETFSFFMSTVNPHAKSLFDEKSSFIKVQYKADNKISEEYKVNYADATKAFGEIIESELVKTKKYKPSIFMPKEACRLFLKVTNVRVERLLEISEEDARKEGVEHLVPRWKDYTNDKGYCYNAWSSFKTLWIKINGIESYTSNPWVWVIEFEQVEKPENF